MFDQLNEDFVSFLREYGVSPEIYVTIPVTEKIQLMSLFRGIGNFFVPRTF